MRPIHVTLCEYATRHSDATISMIRSGISMWWTSRVPLSVGLMAVVEFPELSAGTHPFTLEVKAPHGKPCARIDGEAHAEASQTVRGVVPVTFQALEFGKHEIVVTCSNMTGSTILDILPEKETAQ